ncbi:MAG: helicase-related protein [Treponema sp.]
MKAELLPVYSQKQKILDALEKNRVIVVESPTGSGKTTQMPIILHEAGYSKTGIIGVTQPRRIAVLSVSEFIAKQLKCERPDLIGYKMRFADVTDERTKIKVMTDGILLQELKLDSWLSKYSVIMVDEAHERSLNIDFILGLLKRIVSQRSDFKVIISSATINTELFSSYFFSCPVIKIDAITYPVTLIFDPPAIPASTETQVAENMLYEKITSIIDRVVEEKRRGGVLVFLPGERSIKNCIERLSKERWYKKLMIIPLYGRLSKEEQDRVFLSPSMWKRKVVISTNIAETSITINDINTVIDSGLAKLNFYNPYSFISSLDETLVSKSSCNQRKGRAGRTEEGTCYRLYSRKDFESRPLYTVEEIYRTDLSEVVMRMSELGIYDFDSFDFISPTSKKGIIGAIETLNMLNALEKDHSLSNIGQIMCKFPLPPRQSRMIAEAIISYPNVTEEVIIAAAFLSVRSPFSMPEGYEMEARKAHITFSDKNGDFVSFLKVYRMFISTNEREEFCKKHYLDVKIMEEIVNIKEQLELIVSDMGIPILSGGSVDDYLTSIAKGMIQAVCSRYKRGVYRSLTTEKIVIHPSSCMYREEPRYIVAGEIVRTTRMYAMSVSSLSEKVIKRVAPKLISSCSKVSSKERKEGANYSKQKSENKKLDSGKVIKIFDVLYPVRKMGGKKVAVFDWNNIKVTLKGKSFKDIDEEIHKALKHRQKVSAVLYFDKQKAMEGEKIRTMLYLLSSFDIAPILDSSVSKALNTSFLLPNDMQFLFKFFPFIMKLTTPKKKAKELSFITLFHEKENIFSFRLSSSFNVAIYKTITSIQIIMESFNTSLTEDEKNMLQKLYSALLKF